MWTGDAILMVLAAGGVASLLQANEVAFGIVKYLGAGYLTWLGIGLVRAGWSTWRGRRQMTQSEHLIQLGEDSGGAGAVGAGTVGSGAGGVPESREHTHAQIYWRALSVSLLNPKAILFFVAFFVQFVDPSYPHPWLSFLVLGGFAQAASVLYLSVLILAGAKLADAFRRRAGLRAGITGGAGAIFLGFAVKLSLASAH